MRFHRSTTIGMVTAGLLALALLGPVAWAVLSLRSTPQSDGATVGAWIITAVVLMVAAVAAAALGGALVVLARRVIRHLRGRAS